MSAYSLMLTAARLFYRVAAELCEAAQLCMFILGTQYLGLGVLRHVFGVRYAVYVLVIHTFPSRHGTPLSFKETGDEVFCTTIPSGSLLNNVQCTPCFEGYTMPEFSSDRLPPKVTFLSPHLK